MKAGIIINHDSGAGFRGALRSLAYLYDLWEEKEKSFGVLVKNNKKSLHNSIEVILDISASVFSLFLLSREAFLPPIKSRKFDNYESLRTIHLKGLVINVIKYSFHGRVLCLL